MNERHRLRKVRALTISILVLTWAPGVEAETRSKPALAAAALQSRAELSPVFYRGNAPLAEDEIYFAAEIPRGEARKFEMRTATGQVIVDRSLCPRPVIGADRTVSALPATYGFSAGRFNVDGDPLDLVVLGREDLYARMIRANRVTPQRVRVVGVMRMEECEQVPCAEKTWENDWKVVAVDPADPLYANAGDISDLPEERLGGFAEFWSNYKGPKSGHPQTRVRGFGDRAEALLMLERNESTSGENRREEVSVCQRHAATLLGRQQELLATPKPPPDPVFLRCLERVFSPAYFETAANFDFLLRYGAYQLLTVKLERSGVRMTHALDRMQTLRDNGETHYRFVAYDSPEPGSGNAIFEWVKTKDRNAGCASDFPPQHYEGQPLAPSWEELARAQPS